VAIGVAPQPSDTANKDQRSSASEALAFISGQLQQILFVCYRKAVAIGVAPQPSDTANKDQR
jgi:hypothetical protein